MTENNSLRVNLGCPKYCERWQCVDLTPRDWRVVRGEAIQYLRENKGLRDIRAYNLIEHLTNVGEFFHVAYEALDRNGLLSIRTDNAEFFPFYLPVIHQLGFSAHVSDKYNPHIMNGTRHYCVFTKLHLEHFAKYYNFDIVYIKRDWGTFGARLKALLRKGYSK